MTTSLKQRLSLIDAANAGKCSKHCSKRLRVFYGFAKLGKIRRKEAISIIFMNDIIREDKLLKAIGKYQETVYVREQTDAEASDALHSNRLFSEYSIFFNDKRINGSLELAIRENYEADKNNVPKETRIEIAEALRSHYLLHHPLYKEHNYQLVLNFND